MSGANGDALEWAVALLHAPGERHALRQRPLPDGISELLGIAAATSPEQLADVANRFTEPVSGVREAARFYVREVLLFPQADAYRILGVNEDAPQDVIKQHYRLLQRWLHPDRLQHAGDAVFATRVNIAWQRLRNASQRAQYDATLHQSAQLPAAMEFGAMPAARVWFASQPSAPPLYRWLRRMPLMLLLLVCCGLFWMALQDWYREPESAWSEPGVAKTPGQTQPEKQGNSQPVAKPPRRGQAAISHSPAPAKAPVGIKPGTAQGTEPVLDSPDLIASKVVSIPVHLAANPALQRSRQPSQFESMKPDAAADTAPPPPVAVPLPIPTALPSQAQIEAAQQAGQQLLRYMQQRQKSSPPIWSSPGIQASAEQMRQALNAAGTPRFGAVQWRIGGDTADLVSRYPSQQDGSRGGVFTAALQWREGRWLVTGVGVGQEQ